jgi:multidrug efflux pump subunit AcrA (membrane-fusion protein)
VEEGQVANGNGKYRKRNPVFYISGSILLIVIGVAVLVAFTRGGTKIDPAKLGKVERGDLAKSVVATGKIEPITKVELKSKASGIVEKWFADAGDKVKEGQVLVQLDREQIQAAVREARAALAAAQANERAALADVKDELLERIRKQGAARGKARQPGSAPMRTALHSLPLWAGILGTSSARSRRTRR